MRVDHDDGLANAAASGGDPTTWTRDDPMLRGRDAYDIGYRSTALQDIATEPSVTRSSCCARRATKG